MSVATVNYSIRLGLLEKRRVTNAIRFYCDLSRLDYELIEYPGWLSSLFLLRVTATQRTLTELDKLLKRHCNLSSRPLPSSI